MKETKPELLIATKNPGKVLEVSLLLADLPFTLRSLVDFNIKTVEETGKTFAENAALKAQTYSMQTSLSAIADDSGLEVDVLDGAPGIFSARYSATATSDADRVSVLLANLAHVTENERTARFVAAVALADADGKLIYLAESTCEGMILSEPKGNGGFGYDPVFVPKGHEQTMAELGLDVKNRISHRAQALFAVRQFLLDNPNLLRNQATDPVSAS
ncbi:MAG: XTP/dITP diphosphohydrolase [Blastocatellia bacterium]|jgi:XTP/dITP diphosphohydrolase|nr:XTP/dITP diphosphohydrolase [Blastocatellia bacterium]